MNKRTFLFGLGVGIIIGAALLQLMIIGEKQVNKMDEPVQQETTESELIGYSKTELDQAVAAERKRVEAEYKKKLADKQALLDQVKQDQAKQDAAKDDKNVKETAASENTAVSKSVVVRIPPNSSVTETADILHGSGVISDKKSFISLMRTTKIRAGYFAFEGDLSLSQIRTIITSTPNASPSELSSSDQ
ncbi:hypothetical protein [Paenibacillus sp. CF384]|uniref:hypothetical protein n=1 Tax=Paenibacillus sp. CF384 TaxID=1884382 RepID=UPI000896E347|nr:hypothetical protein [Paenibacillus sp. CF384]SDW26948.1 hypothetical protein SAMN05518855_1001872 [Paenibacillus sp. CF384]